MQFKTIQYEASGGVAILTLNRPEKRNAISFELVEDLLDALALADKSAAQVLIITGSGSAFCSGMDLDNLRHLAEANRTLEENLKDSETMARLFRAIYDFPRPTIAAVNGPAIAGGTGIATACDFTLAVPEATFGYTEVRIGFIPAIVSALLLRQVGEKRARDLLLTGRVFDAEEAFRIGLVTELIEPAKLLARARELAAALMANSPTSIHGTKSLLSQFAGEELTARMSLGQEENARIRMTEDFREGITAFLEKRKPNWKGR